MDIICFSARDEEEVKKSFYQYIDCADRVIISRPSYASPLGNELKSKLSIVKSKSDNLLYRMKALLEESTEEFVFLAADDDYIFKERCEELLLLLNKRSDAVSARILTFLLNRPERGVVELIPYLNSPKVSQRNRQTGNVIKNGKTLVNENFHPLSVDFYSFINREKLLFIVSSFTKLDTETIDNITSAGKILQFIISFSMLLSGTIIDYQYPVYLRGEAKPMRINENYIKRGSVNRAEQLSFASEFRQLAKSRSSWIKIISVMNDIYEYYGNESQYKFHGLKEKRMVELSNTLLDCLQTTQNSINLSLLSIFEEKYTVRLSNADDYRANIFKNDKSIVFQLNPAKFEFNKEIISRFSGIWEGFILDKLSPSELDYMLNIMV